jgi:hypothetical protein
LIRALAWCLRLSRLARRAAAARSARACFSAKVRSVMAGCGRFGGLVIAVRPCVRRAGPL